MPHRHAWASMEARQGERSSVRYLFRQGLQANPRSRYIFLAWAMFEKQEGERDNARHLLASGRQANPRDTAILQVICSLAISALQQL